MNNTAPFVGVLCICLFLLQLADSSTEYPNSLYPPRCCGVILWSPYQKLGCVLCLFIAILDNVLAMGGCTPDQGAELNNIPPLMDGLCACLFLLQPGREGGRWVQHCGFGIWEVSHLFKGSRASLDHLAHQWDDCLAWPILPRVTSHTIHGCCTFRQRSLRKYCNKIAWYLMKQCITLIYEALPT